MSDYAIETEDLCLTYKRKPALDHLTLRLPRGGIHAFVGANGAGKSSLFRVLLGFEPAASGSARILVMASHPPTVRQHCEDRSNRRPSPERFRLAENNTRRPEEGKD